MGGFGLNKETLNAIVGGLIPALAWLFFWMHSEEKGDREPVRLVIVVFIVGMLSVFIAIPLEHLVQPYLADNTRALMISWATIEEVVKYVAVAIIIKNNFYVNDPIDFPMYLIAGALGFAGLENILFLMNPDIVNNVGSQFLTGNLRYLGSTLLHAVSTAFVGIGIGLSFFQGWKNLFIYLLGGLFAAVTLHSMFNLFIMNATNQQFFKIFGLLWVVTIISILLLEKLRRLKGQNNVE
jgi:RsiW-degrading membrane proteinase PrsW (M82 family)